jgi:hypothetical protein
MKDLLGLFFLPFAMSIIILLLLYAQIKYFFGLENDEEE